jgi:hypothetical protein
MSLNLGSHMKEAYVCAALTEVPKEDQPWVKAFYTSIADVFEDIIGIRAFVPHEHCDPIKHAQFTPAEVYAAEHKKVCEDTSILVVAALFPTWSGGMEVQMANEHDVPIVLLVEKQKLETVGLSRLLRGSPKISTTIIYDDQADCLDRLAKFLQGRLAFKSTLLAGICRRPA